MSSRGGASCFLRWCVIAVIAAVILGHNAAEGFDEVEAILTAVLKEAPEIVKKILEMWDQLGKTATGVLSFDFAYHRTARQFGVNATLCYASFFFWIVRFEYRPCH
jgi:hypothetical protein